MKPETPAPDPAPRTFTEALEILNIQDFEDRIWRSNSHGELMHLQDYFDFARSMGHAPDAFRYVFTKMVCHAEETWTRPESVFQHMPKLFLAYFNSLKKDPASI